MGRPTIGDRAAHSDEQLIQCPVQQQHVWCYDCCWGYLRQNPSEILAEGLWGEGCPHCRQVEQCPCALSRADADLLLSQIPADVWGRGGVLSDQLSVAVRWAQKVRRQAALPAGLRRGGAGRQRLEHCNIRADGEAAEFHEKTILGRHPVVVSGIHLQLNRELWCEGNLQRKAGAAPVVVRRLCVDPKDDSVFAILSDHPSTLEQYLSLSGCQTPEYPVDDFDVGKAEKHGLRITTYLKDFFFRDLYPEWVVDMEKNIPQYIKTWDCSELLPAQVRPETLMAFIGNHQSRTPMHVDKLGTIAYNLCVSGGGCKEWWFIHHEDTPLLERIIKYRGGNLWHDNFWVDPKDLESSGIRHYFVQQRIGDLVIVPPGVPHQVRNRGTSLAVAANIVHTGTVAISYDILKRYRREHVPSVYRLKAQIYCALRDVVSHPSRYPNVLRSPELDWFRTLLTTFKSTLEEEHLPERLLPLFQLSACPDEVPFLRTCDCCFTDIFNRYLHCEFCGSIDEPGSDSCVQCFLANKGGFHEHPLALFETYSLDHLQQLVNQADVLLSSAPTVDLCSSSTSC
ncbi:MAG: hypothetical protein Q8P67_08590 [archaeon]|nr:hypothetical protein [archaeon]